MEKRRQVLIDANQQQALGVEEMKMNAETIMEKLKTYVDDPILHADKIYESFKQSAECVDELDHVIDESLLVNFHNEYITKYKEN